MARSIRVLVIRREDSLFESMIEIFRKRGFEVEFAGNLERGAGIGRRRLCDIVVADFQLIQEHGAGFGALFGSLDPRPKLVITSEESIWNILEDVREIRASDIHSYPVNVDSVADSIERLGRLVL